MKQVLVVALLTLAGSPAWTAGASNFTLVNGTGAPLADLSIRRSGSQDWRTLGAAPSAGARAPVNFSDPDCAFDIRARGADGQPITWAGVNLCGAKSVTLRKDGSAGAWVDYDQ